MRPLPTRPEILYSPPKSSSFGHSASARNPEKGWQETLAFLEGLTENNLHVPLKLSIRNYPSHPDWCDASVVKACIEEAREIFGKPTKSHGDLIGNWELDRELLDQAVAFSLRDLNRPRQKLGPTRLSFFYIFSWKNNELLPQIERPGEGSFFSVTHGWRRLFLQPTFRFPFEAVTPDFEAFISHIKPLLPFKLREACFKAVLPSAPGKMPRLRKIPSGWLQE